VYKNVCAMSLQPDAGAEPLDGAAFMNETQEAETVKASSYPHEHSVLSGYKISGDAGSNWSRFRLEYAVVRQRKMQD